MNLIYGTAELDPRPHPWSGAGWLLAPRSHAGSWTPGLPGVKFRPDARAATGKLGGSLLAILASCRGMLKETSSLSDLNL